MQTQPAFDTHYYDTHTGVRYVVTHLDTKGMRTLLNPQQGRYTHATKEEAEQELASILANNCEESAPASAGTITTIRSASGSTETNGPAFGSGLSFLTSMAYIMML